MDGEFVSIVGPSDCGKTTFLSVVDGLIAASAGRILVDGRVVTKPGPDRAVVFQDASLLPWRTVLTNVRYGLECLNVGAREAKERASHFIEMVGLSGFEHHYPYELSGGMQQRVNLARALVMDPKILLMDEPFASLDAQTREVMQEELLQIWVKAKKTVLFVTHQIDEAIYLSDRVVVFSGRPGKVKETIPVAIERPRRLAVKREARFAAIEDRIWSLIEEDGKADANRRNVAQRDGSFESMVDPRDDNGGKLREDAMRLGRLRIAAVSLFAFALGAAATSVRAADPIPFKIGISAPVVTIFPVWMGEAGGFYQKEGLKVDVINMEGGTRGLQVLLSGEIQGMHVGLAPAVLANKQGADLRLVTSTCNTIPITMFTKAGVGMGDLKGKTFGISTFGSETDVAISILLKQLGLTRSDVTVSQIGGSSQRFAALIAGRIDVAPLIEPAITLAKERGFNPIIDLAAAKTPW